MHIYLSTAVADPGTVVVRRDPRGLAVVVACVPEIPKRGRTVALERVAR